MCLCVFNGATFRKSFTYRDLLQGGLKLGFLLLDVLARRKRQLGHDERGVEGL